MNKTIITIGRQYGSGGREVGKKLAAALGIGYYDKELLTLAAKKSGLSAEFLDRCDESHTGSLLFSLVMGDPNAFIGSGFNTSVQQMAAKAQHDAITAAAEKGSCVIVGRCADYVLQNEPGLVRVFICADEEFRIRRVCEAEKLSRKDAAVKMRRLDKSRMSYYNYNTDKNWGVSSNYDLCLNTASLGTDGAVDMILHYIGLK